MSLYKNFVGIDIGKFEFVVSVRGKKVTKPYENTLPLQRHLDTRAKDQIKKSSFNKETAIPDKINIQSYHPFTEQQISFILGYQKKYNITNTHLTIDDRTEDNCLKEQLKL